MILEITEFILVGVGVGFISSFIGFGGGTLIVPLLPIISHVNIKTAIASSLVLVALNSANNSYRFHKKKLIKWNLVFVMATTSILFGTLSSFLTNSLEEKVVQWVAIVVFSFLALISLLGPNFVPSFLRKDIRRNHLLAGIGAGTFSGLSGLGGGTVLVPIFLIGKWTKNEEMSPTGNAMNMLTAGAGALTLIFSKQEILWTAILVILLTAMLVGNVARKHQHSLSEKWRRIFVFCYLLAVIALQINTALN